MAYEKLREREPEPQQVQPDPWYENMLERDRENAQRRQKGLILLRGADLPLHQNRQSRVKHYLDIQKTDTAVTDMNVFVHEIWRHSGMHRHQGGLSIYVLEGRGHTVVNGVSEEWEAGDLLLLPLMPGGVDHQHFNDGVELARWLALIYKPWHEIIGNQMVQVTESPQWADFAAATGQTAAPVQLEAPRVEVSFPTGLPPANDGTLLDAVFLRRDAYRAQVAGAANVVKGRDLSWELNRQGRMKWYMHPDKTDTPIRTQLIWVQEILPGSRSGRQLHPGGLVHFFLKGSGYSIVDGVRLSWTAGDCLALPQRLNGVEYQHFNPSREEPCEFIAMMPNILETLGADGGARLEQLDVAPEYARAQSAR
jgi:mannose-6-phosphate isomerase-like protein (cupin superfamily)